MNTKIITATTKTKQTKNDIRLPSEVGAMLTKRVLYDVNRGEILHPDLLWDKILSEPLISATFVKIRDQVESELSDLELIDKHHAISTARRLAVSLLNITKYQNGQNLRDACPYVLAALLHKSNAETIAEYSELWDKNGGRANIVKIINNCRINRNRIMVILHQKKCHETALQFLLNGLKEPAELLLYCASVMGYLTSYPAAYISPKDISFAEIVANLADSFGLEGMASTIHSLLFQLTSQEEPEFVKQLIQEKYGMERWALEEALSQQANALLSLVTKQGIKAEDVVITGRIKEEHSIDKKLNKEKAIVSRSEMLKLFPDNGSRILELLLNHSELLVHNTSNPESWEIAKSFFSDGEGMHSLMPSALTLAEVDAVQKLFWEKRCPLDILAWRIVFAKDSDLHRFSKWLCVDGLKHTIDQNLPADKQQTRVYAAQRSDLAQIFIPYGYKPIIKHNGYTSVHLNIDPTSKLTASLQLNYAGELQLRTAAQHRDAEFGTSSHQSYKKGNETPQPIDKKTFTERFHERKKHIQGTIIIKYNGINQNYRADEKNLLSLGDFYAQVMIRIDQTPVFLVNDVPVIDWSTQLLTGDKVTISYEEKTTLSQYFEYLLPTDIDRVKLIKQMLNSRYFSPTQNSTLGKEAQSLIKKGRRTKEKLVKQSMSNTQFIARIRDICEKRSKSGGTLSETEIWFALGLGIIQEEYIATSIKTDIQKLSRKRAHHKRGRRG